MACLVLMRLRFLVVLLALLDQAMAEGAADEDEELADAEEEEDEEDEEPDVADAAALKHKVGRQHQHSMEWNTRHSATALAFAVEPKCCFGLSMSKPGLCWLAFATWAT